MRTITLIASATNSNVDWIVALLEQINQRDRFSRISFFAAGRQFGSVHGLRQAIKTILVGGVAMHCFEMRCYCGDMIAESWSIEMLADAQSGAEFGAILHETNRGKAEIESLVECLRGKGLEVAVPK